MAYRHVIICGGSDSSSGAGIQCDSRVLASLGIVPQVAITAVTAQTNEKVFAIGEVDPGLLRQQLTSCVPANSLIKVGMLPSTSHAKILNGLVDSDLIVDPVLRSSSGQIMGEKEAYLMLAGKTLLFTPNIPETEAITGTKINTMDHVVHSAELLRDLGFNAVLIKGGHLSTGDKVHDYFCDGEGSFWITTWKGPYLKRGTGCALASGVAGFLAKGESLRDAVVGSMMLMASAFYEPNPVLKLPTWPKVNKGVMPWVTIGKEPKDRFPDHGFAKDVTGFYPIIDRASWIPKLAGSGVKTLQLRIKDLSDNDLAREIEEGINVARQHHINLYINDHWQLAVEFNAYGVHLGQEDLGSADMTLLHEAGLRVGISTHSLYEAAIGHRYNPSYLAFGPIFPTTCKSMAFGPQGFERLKDWLSLWPYPIVPIGGLKLHHSCELQQIGLNNAAVISDITNDKNPEARAKAWCSALIVSSHLQSIRPNRLTGHNIMTASS